MHHGSRRGSTAVIAAAAAAAVAAVTASTSLFSLVHADEPAHETGLPQTERTLPFDGVYAWGSNKGRVVAPGSQAAAVPTPTVMPDLVGTFRDVQLSATYGVAVDARGDVVQWGEGYAQGAPRRTLIGYDISRVQLTSDKIYALARNGTVYVVPARADDQQVSSGIFAGASVKPVAAAFQGKSERIADIAAGDHHLIALSTHGRVWSMPLDEQANDYGQLGTSSVTVDGKDVQLVPRVARGEQLASPPAPVLRVVPALRDVKVDEIAAGAEHSLARTPEGRVVAWGRNNIGQLGVGPGILAETVAVPTEVVFPTSLVGRTANCVKIAAGGANSFYVVQGRGAPRTKEEQESRLPVPQSRIDVLAAGGGARGTLGSGQRPQAAGVPVRVKAISGLYEYSEQANGLVPIGIHDIIVGDGHVAAVLDAPAIGNETHRDVYVWGANDSFQLGTGRKGNTAAPALLTLGDSARDNKESPIMNRLQLVERKGSFLGGGGAGQTLTAGAGGMAIYTRA
ncbi:hypothetical protein MCUN1_001480 [Malassezia cuniculi]|uniref:Uncharacterized protein n=1 Tax=Malassezia cuniculi TaxID=948313 RepID=A0AAF0EU63_9BASI|nr:hypothetical protein MCUN1_001480 [Malassezia cuniculi]